MSNFEISLHKGQQLIFNDPHKVRVFLAGRRTGKSKLMTYELLLAALRFQGRTDLTSPQRVLGALPTLTQARRILWTPLINLLEQTSLSKYVKSISKTEFRIQFEGGKPDIIIAGANDQDGASLRGNRFWFCGLDEFQHYKPGVFDAAIYPAMSDTKGSRALITGTPLGKGSYFHEIYQRAEKYPDVYASFQMPTWTNPCIDPVEIEVARRTLPPKLFDQEFNANWNSNEFAIYSELDEVENRCDRLPSSFDKVVMGLDHGDTNPAIVVLGCLDNVWYFLEAWSPSGSVIPTPYLEAKLVEFASRWQPVATFCDPSRPSSILSVRSLGKKHGLIGLAKAVAGYNPIQEGNNQVHSLIFQRRYMIPREDTTRGRKDHVSGDKFFQLMSSYHYLVDKDGLVTDKVAPNQPDHTQDANRYILARKSGA